MDLEDSFTEKLLRRNKARKEHFNEVKIETMSTGKKRTALVDEQNINFGSKDLTSEESPKRHCSQAPESMYSSHDKENYHMEEEDSEASIIPLHTASNVRGLAALKKNFIIGEDENLQAPSTATSTKSQGSTNSSKCPSKSPTKSSKDDLQSFELRKDSCLADDEYSDYDDEDIDENDFAENYDQISLEHKNPVKMDCTPVKLTEKQQNLNLQEKVTAGNNTAPVVKKAALIQPNVLPQVAVEALNTSVDPAELPLSARKALFEKALLGGTSKQNENIVDNKLSVAQRAAMFENASKLKAGPRSCSNLREPKRVAIPNFTSNDTGSVMKSSPVKNFQHFTKSPIKKSETAPVNSPLKTTIFKSSSLPITVSPVKNVSPLVVLTPSPTKNVGSHTRLMQQKLLEGSGSSLHGKEIAAKAVEERQQELTNLVDHWEKISSSSAENNSEQNPVTSEEKISRESDAIPEFSEYDEGSLSGEEPPIEEEYEEHEEEMQKECYEEESDKSDDAESVFYASDVEIKSMKSEESNYTNEMQDVHSSIQPIRGVISPSMSNSGFSSYSDESNCNVSKSITSDSSATEEPSSKRSCPDVPLTYTVSFYRKQKQETRLTPVRTIVRRENVLSSGSTDVDYTQVIQEQIKSLQEDILRQQTVISQTSQALNLCSASSEFSGSTEQVEGERLLLIATQKRQACLNEIQRLKTCGAQGEYAGDGKGTLTITDLQLPLKREFMASQLAGKGNDAVHYFLCLIRHGAQVIVTQMMSTDDKISDGALCFTNHIKLQNLPADFSVVFEVYALQTKKEVLPHEKKYHIKKEHSKIRLTPKGKKSDGKLPAVSSPGGPNAVRSPSFGVVGYSRFTLQNCNKKTFTLDKVPFSSPLEGILRVKLQLHSEHKIVEKGFLTMFEDVSGFGAWHRRWCALDAHHLSYWKYPDDEHKKAPIDTIDLKQCVTGEVKLVSRDVCARPHTFQLVTVRPQAKGDKNTLISRSYNTLTSTKYLLSADTKEERILWCNKLNEALTNVRKWDPQALRPVESLQN